MNEKNSFEYVGTTVYQLEYYSTPRGYGGPFRRNRVYAQVQGYRDTPNEELEATARLFAAAPDLLEALQEMTYWFGAYPEFVPKVEMVDNYKKAIARAQTAIIKAQTENNV